MRGRRGLFVVVLVVLFFPLVACAQGSGGYDPSRVLRITSPQGDTTVTEPFTVGVSAGPRLGPPGQASYLQVFYDGLPGPVVTTESFEVSDLPPGEHAIHVSLLNPDGTPAGGEDEIVVTVSGGTRS